MRGRDRPDRRDPSDRSDRADCRDGPDGPDRPDQPDLSAAAAEPPALSPWFALLAVLAAVVALVGLAAPAAAHGLRLFVQPEGTTIHGRAYYAGGEPAAGNRVAFHAPAGSTAEAASTRTDADGRFVQTLAASGPVRVVVDGGDGHRAEATVVLTAAAIATEAGTAVAAEAAQLRALVESAVRAELRPLHERIDRLDRRIRFGDVVAGVGLLVGLAGGWALWHARTLAAGPPRTGGR